MWVTRHQDGICSLGIEPFSTSVTYMCMYIYICIYIYVYIFVCSMPHIGVWSTCMGAYMRICLCVFMQAPTGILGAVRACKHVFRVREGSRNGCGICQACLRQASAVGGKKSLGSWGFFYFYGSWVVGGCVRVYARTHTQTTWVLDVSPGVGRTPGEPEESRSTKAQYTCRPYKCTVM